MSGSSGSDPVRAAEIAELIRLGRKYKWAQGEERARLEAGGVNLVRTDFYSDTPTLADIAASFEYAGARGVNDAPAAFDDPAVFDELKIVAYAEGLLPHAAFDAPEIDDGSGFHWKNSQFSGTDAVLLWAMLRKLRPRRVVEVGSGWSSHLARRALAENGSGALTCIDPEPRTDIAGLPETEIVRAAVQDLPVDWFNERLGPGDIFFYDGSHTVKTGSDTVYVYLKVLPYLRPGVIVHVHDVRLPYPRNRKALEEAKLYWGEPYLLMAHLHNRARYDVLVGSEFLQRRHKPLSQALLAGRAPSGGVSLWFAIRS